MRKILIFLLPIWLFGTSCEEAIELSVEEFIKVERNATATALVSERAVQICLAEYGEEHESTIIALNNSGSFSYENRRVEYSAAKTIEYDGQEARVTMFVPVGEFINGGTYTAYLFCDGQMIGSDSVSIN